MTQEVLFPFADYWWFYAGFIVFVLAVLLLDLGVFHKKAHVVRFREATAWTIFWISLALIFNYLFYQYTLTKVSPEIAKQLGLEFLTGFVVEKALAVDNVFVFAVVFSYFGIPAIYQHKILFYGILGALFFRALFIALGSYLMAYQSVVIFFGVFLIFTGIKMFFAPEKPMDPEKNPVMKLLRKFIRISPSFDGAKMFTRQNGLLMATPLFVTLVIIEVSDIIFAVDSVPAIFALTKEPLIVFTSNIFAILGLRAMYFMISGVLDKFHMLKYGLASVLIFVGLKMAWLNEHFGGKFPIGVSLAIIAFLIGGSIALSLAYPKKTA
ncbi:Inner membrane protein alx [compost metagenome]